MDGQQRKKELGEIRNQVRSIVGGAAQVQVKVCERIDGEDSGKYEVFKALTNTSTR